MSDKKQFHRVATLTEIPPQSGQTVWVGKQAIALFNLNGKLYAIDDRCPHRGASLSLGMLAGERVLCPLHLFDFDLLTGECGAAGGLNVATYEVRVEGGEVFVLA